VFLDTYGEYISTIEYGSLLDAQGAMPNAPTTPNHDNHYHVFFINRVFIPLFVCCHLFKHDYITSFRNLVANCSTNKW